MPKATEIASCLFPLAIGSAIGASGLALATVATSTAATVVGNVIAGLSLNYSSASIHPLLGHFTSTEWEAVNFDLNRVAGHALLTILYETLTQSPVDEPPETLLFKSGFGEGNTLADYASRVRKAFGQIDETAANRPLTARQASKAVEEAANAWELRIFVEAVPDQVELIDFLRHPQPLAPERAALMARAILRTEYVAWQPNYAVAIASRFAHLFEILLRQDTRAYRGSTIYLQRLALDKIEGLRADVAKAITAITKPQPDLERYVAHQKRDTTPDITDLQFKCRATEFLFREPDKTRIEEWRRSDLPLAILKITGPAGMGKSRLALQICDECQAEYWLAGFLRAERAWPPDWTPLRDTILVLDYAASKSVDKMSAFVWLESLFEKSTRSAPKIRVILIDRSDRGPLWSSWESSEIHTRLDKLTLHIALDPDRAEFDRIVGTELRRRLEHEPSAAHRKAIEDLIPRLRGQIRPLFGMLAAAAVAENPQTHRWSPELLIENVLLAQLQQWRVAGVRDEHLDLLFEATWTQGECNKDPGFTQRVEALSPAELASLASLSEPGYTLGHIVPDLLGEFFVLMRLQGKAAALDTTRQETVNIRKAREILDRLWPQETVAQYAGLVLEDFLAWKPEKGSNPALDIMERALDAVEQGADSFGLQYCLFASAWNRPEEREWDAWLDRSAVSASKAGLAIALAIGLVNATFVETDPAKCLELADRIASLHDTFNHEPAVREQLAQALFNATFRETDPAKCLELADRIASLHDTFNHEPAVREQLANALTNTTARETDPAKCLELADRIASLHDTFNHEPAVREQLAKALFNATVVETDPAKCLELAGRIESLHDNFNHEPAVRELLAKALFNATVVETDPAKCLELAGRIESLHDNFNHEPAVRELLAKALLKATVVETDPAKCLELAGRIESLHDNFNHEPAVRELLAKALLKATVVETDPAKRLKIAGRIASLHDTFNHEPAVREQLANALFNATVVETDPAKRLEIADRIASLHDTFNHEPAVRESLAKALFNATFRETDPAKRANLIERLSRLAAQYPVEPLPSEALRLAQSI